MKEASKIISWKENGEGGGLEKNKFISAKKTGEIMKRDKSYFGEGGKDNVGDERR